MYPDPKRARKFTAVDILVAIAVIAFTSYVVFRTNSVLAYRWDWSTAVDWLWRLDEDSGEGHMGILLQGVMTTLRISIWAMLLAALIGFAAGAMRTSKRLLPRLIAGSFVILIRNIPPLVFIFIFYFFISSQVLPSLDWDQGQTALWIGWLVGPPEIAENLIAGILCLAIFEAAYITEIVRAGIQSVPKGQYEAGKSIGLGKLHIFLHIVLPQALRTTLPPLANQFIMLIKNSALVSLISVQELTFSGQELATSSGKGFEVWIVVAMLYFVLCFALSRVFARLESASNLARR